MYCFWLGTLAREIFGNSAIVLWINFDQLTFVLTSSHSSLQMHSTSDILSDNTNCSLTCQNLDFISRMRSQPNCALWRERVTPNFDGLGFEPMVCAGLPVATRSNKMYNRYTPTHFPKSLIVTSSLPYVRLKDWSNVQRNTWFIGVYCGLRLKKGRVTG